MSGTKKILIVDDDKTLRDTLAEQIAVHVEFVTDAAETGAAGLEKAKASQIDLILLDTAASRSFMLIITSGLSRK